MLFKFLSYAPSIVGLTLIGLVTYLKNAKDTLHILFFLMAGSIAAWLTLLLAADLTISAPLSLWSLRAAACMGTAIIPIMLYFSVYFPVRVHRIGRVFHVAAIAPAVFFMAVALTPLLIPDVVLQPLSAQPAKLTFLYTLQSVYAVGGIVTSFVIMLRKLRRLAARERAQIRLVITGILFALAVNFITGFILAMTSQANNYSNLAGSLSFLVFIGTTSYAIVKHRLFDIRLAITRTLGFAITIGILSVVYCLLVLGIGAPLVTNGRVTLVRDNLQLLLILPPTIVAALTFHSLQTFIARITKGIFYQDSYDTRTTLDQFSDALISDNDMKAIITKGLSVLRDAIKPIHAVLVIMDDEGKIYRKHLIDRDEPADLPALIDEARRFKGRMMVKDEVPAGKWPGLLEHEDISLLLRLGTLKKTTGILFLGPRQNGRIYSRQDTELLTVSAKNFAIALENARKYEQIAAFADTMHQEVLRATANLRHANKQLKTLDAMKDDFISMASHQLRSPATSVHEAIQMLNQDYVSPEERSRLIELAEASSERLVNVIVDMLSIARIQAGHFTIEKSDVDLAELTQRAILETSGLAKQKNITVKFDAPNSPAKLSADRAKLNEIMSNYIENAIQYSPPDSEITVAVRHEKQRLYFEVSDQGIGVPPEERKNLFGKFYRAPNARHEQPNGNGIGLFVVKTVAEAHGGDAYYQPLEPGSRFGFWLPV